MCLLREKGMKRPGSLSKRLERLVVCHSVRHEHCMVMVSDQ